MAYLDLHVVCSIILYIVHATLLHLYCLHVVYQSECTVLIPGFISRGGQGGLSPPGNLVAPLENIPWYHNNIIITREKEREM